ncbi:hypothetical protein BD560DRAFT_424243 [Blakeslea trispora]|nr:hypothetical protein BD560DRAFT_424243 [Blakeslea trispora]
MILKLDLLQVLLSLFVSCARNQMKYHRYLAKSKALATSSPLGENERYKIPDMNFIYVNHRLGCVEMGTLMRKVRDKGVVLYYMLYASNGSSEMLIELLVAIISRFPLIVLFYIMLSMI